MPSSTPPAAAADDAVMARMLAREVRDSDLDLSIGEPDQPLPTELAEVATRSLLAGRTGYTPKLGLDELRAAVADDTAGTGYRPEVDDVAIVVGGTEAVSVAMRAACAAGDAIVVPDPAWPNYRVVAEHHGLTVRTYRQGVAGSFFDLDGIRSALQEGARMVVVNSPSNPVGSVATADELAELVELVRGFGASILSDEAYESIVFSGGRAPSPLATGADLTFSARTFSKTFSMTGLRVGSLVSPPAYRGPVVAVHGTTSGCAPITGQLVALAALQGSLGRGAELSSVYARRYELARSIVGDWMPAGPLHGFGGFYAWLDISSTGRTGADVVAAARDAGVLISDGAVFAPGAAAVRVALTASEPELERALRAVRAAL